MQKHEFNQKIASLLVKAKNGCQKSFGDLYTLTQPMLMSFLRKMRYQECDVEEILQNTFLTLCRNNTFDPNKCNPCSYMFMITQRKAIDHVRRIKSLKRHTPTCDISLANPEARADNTANNIDNEEFNRIINLMTKVDAELIKLHFVYDYTYEELGKMTKTCGTTIKTRFRRAFIQAREKLGEDYEKHK